MSSRGRSAQPVPACASLLLLTLALHHALPAATRAATVDLSTVTEPMTRLSTETTPLDLQRVPVELRPGDVHRCCFDHITTTYDERGDPVAGVVDDFLCDVDRVRDEALGRAERDNTRWNHYVKPPVEDGTNNAFPGWRGTVAPRTARDIQLCGAYVVRALWPQIPTDVFRHGAMPEVRHVYGLATVQADDMVNSQRLAHTDVDFQWGTDHGVIPKGLATVFGLTTRHNKTGTAFYREKSTGISLMKTLPEMEGMWGSVTRVHKKLDLSFRDGISSFGHYDNPWMKSIAAVPVRYNRFTMYDMRRLHNIYYADADATLLEPDPERGRLAINTFIYSGSAKFRYCGGLAALPEGCRVCVSDPQCAWVLASNKCLPSEHAVRRHHRQDMAMGFKQMHKCPQGRVYEMLGVGGVQCYGRMCVPGGDGAVKGWKKAMQPRKGEPKGVVEL